VTCKSTDVTEEYVASIFGVEKWAKEETREKQVANSTGSIPVDYTALYNHRCDNLKPYYN
jgi:hypothetical protein